MVNGFILKSVKIHHLEGQQIRILATQEIWKLFNRPGGASLCGHIWRYCGFCSLWFLYSVHSILSAILWGSCGVICITNGNIMRQTGEGKNQAELCYVDFDLIELKDSALDMWVRYVFSPFFYFFNLRKYRYTILPVLLQCRKVLKLAKINKFNFVTILY